AAEIDLEHHEAVAGEHLVRAAERFDRRAARTAVRIDDERIAGAGDVAHRPSQHALDRHAFAVRPLDRLDGAELYFLVRDPGIRGCQPNRCRKAGALLAGRPEIARFRAVT